MKAAMTTQSEYLRISAPIELKFTSETADGVISGYASTFGGEPDTYGHVIEHGAFSESLARHKNAGTSPMMFWNHNPDRPVGRWNSVNEDLRGLKVSGRLNLGTSAGRDAYAHVKAGDLNGLSIGFTRLRSDSKAGPNGATVLSKLDVHEVSIVSLPANRSARITDVKSFGSRAELESILREHLPARAVKKLLSGGWPAVSGDDEPQPDPALEELLAAVKSARLEIKGL